MGAHAMQMTMFPDLEPEPLEAEPPQQAEWDETIVIDPGPVGCVSTVGCDRRCKKPGVYLKGGYVMCERHMRDSVWSEMSATKESRERHPHVLCCVDGFKAVKRMGREDHRALGEHQRVQICRDRKCGGDFRRAPVVDRRAAAVSGMPERGAARDPWADSGNPLKFPFSLDSPPLGLGPGSRTRWPPDGPNKTTEYTHN